MARFEDVEDISFVDDIKLQDIINDCMATYKSKYKELSGINSPIPYEERSHIYAYSLQLYQLAQNIDEKAKQNFLKYATGEYLDNIALNKGVLRKQLEKSIVSVKFTLSAVQPKTIPIPQGTRITTIDSIKFFETREYSEIPAGQPHSIVVCEAQEGGADGNDFLIGEINVLVDVIAYIEKVENIDVPSGGSDIEDDDAFALRVHESRNLHSTTGAENAYKYFVKEFSSSIHDVCVKNPSGADIVISILTKDRKKVTQTFLDELLEFLQNRDIKALTDKITVKNVSTVNYMIDIGYYIQSSDAARVMLIQENIAKAVDEYKMWQSEKIGRDINSQKLISFMLLAGAKRVVLTSSQNIVIASDSVANCIDTTVEYLGIEED